jgi:Subtilase family
MSLRLSRRRAAIAVASAAAVVGTSFFSGTASAAPVAEPVSTPVPIVTPDGMLMSYILNTARSSNPGQVEVLETAVRKAGGVVVQSWPEIGVVVAHSDRAAFRADVAASAGGALDSVGATRTVAVSEGTPEAAGASWGRGASDYKQGAKKDYNGDLPGEQAPAMAADPREGEQWDMVQIKADQAHQITDGSRNVLVGVLDTGIAPEHPDLKPNIDVANSVNCADAGRPDLSPTGWYDSKGVSGYHGTHVAGTIATARDGIGIVGVAPKVRIASVKVTNTDGFIYPEYAVCGFVWAGLKHMDVTNNSYFVDPFMYYCEDQPDQYAAK